MPYTEDTAPYTFRYVVERTWNESTCVTRYQVRNIYTDEIVYSTLDRNDAHHQCDYLNAYYRKVGE